MLDQNTDRMWFVIGALVVGAGIILLANKAIPEIFANTVSAMNNIVTSEFGNPNLLKDASKEIMVTNSSSSSYALNYHDRHLVEPLVEGETYTVSFYARSPIATKFNQGIFINRGTKDIPMNDTSISPEYKFYYGTFKFVDELYNGNHFYLHIYPYVNQEVYVKNVKLEKGDKATTGSSLQERLFNNMGGA